MALERNPPACKAMARAGWEVASHGYRWWDYQNVDEAMEREHIQRTVKIHEEMGLGRPVGMYQGKASRCFSSKFQLSVLFCASMLLYIHHALICDIMNSFITCVLLEKNVCGTAAERQHA
mmetsp:Transcript_28995/g.59127  ORF Transcript_28995/g.59127 Transcript_28995/m.59127 type:complete len:120 (-) Transcript_28995:674-1033(-)